jgi:hypothetical protein
MSRINLSLVAVALVLSSAANAQGLDTARNHRHHRQETSQNYSDSQPAGWGTGERHIRSANDCAPDRPEPVWGANSELLGYSCASPSANPN